MPMSLSASQMIMMELRHETLMNGLFSHHFKSLQIIPIFSNLSEKFILIKKRIADLENWTINFSNIQKG